MSDNKVVSFKKRKSGTEEDKDLTWLCGECGSRLFRLHCDGLVECAGCQSPSTNLAVIED